MNNEDYKYQTHNQIATTSLNNRFIAKNKMDKFGLYVKLLYLCPRIKETAT